jgi:hypothetical protein
MCRDKQRDLWGIDLEDLTFVMGDNYTYIYGPFLATSELDINIPPPALHYTPSRNPQTSHSSWSLSDNSLSSPWPLALHPSRLSPRERLPGTGTAAKDPVPGLARQM